MCGIFGLLAELPEDQVTRQLLAMRASLAHRGPDGHGEELLPAGNGRLLGLGHVRLSIVAPTARSAAQPMTDETGRYVMSFNGEIYNYLELMPRLEARGHRFAAASDSAVLLAAFAEWGADCLPKLRGMFAFAVWDRKRHRLFLARDANGKKPLWLRRVGSGIAFGSEIQALTTPVGRPVAMASDIDPGAVGDYLVYKYVPRNRSFIRDLEELPPGTWVEIDGACPMPEIAPVTWYTPPARARPTRRTMTASDMTAFRAALEEAIRIRLRADVPLGVFLSGGIDSSAVLALATRLQGAPIQSFCVAFEDGEETYSEAWAADIVARRFGARHRVLRLQPSGFLQAIEAATWHRGAPLGEIADVALFKLSAMARESVKTVLSGEGADELLAGYPRYWGEVWARRWQALVPGWADVIPRQLSRRLPYSARRGAIMARAAAERDFATRQAGWFGAISPRDLASIAPTLSSPGLPGWSYPASGRDGAIQSAMAFDKAHWLPANILARGDRMTMAAGLEMRMPFMDTVLAEQVSRLPEGAFMQGRTGKPILRQALSDLLPDQITSRPKHGFRVPFHEWCRGPLRETLHARLLDPSAASRTFVSRAAVERMLRAHMNREVNHEKALWALYGLEVHLSQLAKPN